MSKFLQMRHSHSYVLYSPSFYTSVFGYRLCLRLDCIFTVLHTLHNAWSDNGGMTKLFKETGESTMVDGDMFHHVHVRCNVTIAQGNEEHLGLFIHVVRGDNDDALRWPMQVKKLGSHWSSTAIKCLHEKKGPPRGGSIPNDVCCSYPYHRSPNMSEKLHTHLYKWTLHPISIVLDNSSESCRLS